MNLKLIQNNLLFIYRLSKNTIRIFYLIFTLLVCLNCEAGPSNSSELENSPTTDETASLLNIKKITSNLFEVQGDLNPVEGEMYILSAQFRILKDVDQRIRERLAYKYGELENEYIGWAISLKRYYKQTRPELYWKGRYGEDGWLTFDNYEFKTDHSYKLAYIIYPKNYALCYVYDLESGEKNFLGAIQITSNAESNFPLVYGVKNDDGYFKGKLESFNIYRSKSISESKKALEKQIDKIGDFNDYFSKSEVFPSRYTDTNQ